MSALGLAIGIIVLLGMFIGFIPCLGWWNWINIPVAIIGLIIGIVGVATSPDRAVAWAGVVCCAIAIFFGIVRLIMGAGII